jgi:hypothetical protein
MQNDNVRSLITKIANYKLRLTDSEDARMKATLEALIELAERELAVHVRNAAAVKPIEAYGALRRRPEDKPVPDMPPDAPSAQIT